MTAQNKLGELFVDIGVGGLGKTLKGLNSISASFLMTKNAAVQMTKPILDMTQEFGKNASALEKLKTRFGTTIDQAQRMQAIFKIKDIENATSDIAALSDVFGKLANNEPIDADFLKTLARLNIDINSYNGSLEDTLRLYDDIGDALNNLDYASGEDFARRLGVDRTNLLYAHNRGVRFANLPRQANELSQAQVNQAIKGEEDLRKLQLDLFRALQNIFVKNEGVILKVINGLDNFVNSGNFQNKIQDTLNIIKNNFQLLLAGLAGYMLGGRKGAIVALGGYATAKKIGQGIVEGSTPLSVSPYGTSSSGQMNLSPSALKSTFDNNHTGGLFRNPFTQGDNITVNQNIVSPDPVTAGRESARKLEEVRQNAKAYSIRN